MIHVVSRRSGEPSGLGQVLRGALALGRLVEAGECAGLSGATVLNVDFPRPLPLSNRNYVWTTFESDRIPPQWVADINTCYRAVFVPHAAVAKAFVDSGVTRPVHTVHQGFTRLRRTAPLPPRSGPLVVGIVGHLVPRKNVAGLIAAVTSLRARGYDLRLVVQGTADLLPAVRETLARHAADPGLSLGFRPRLSDDELAAWYSALHAYVFPSSGEGWSMTPRESMYLGIPTLVSDIAVHRDLLASGLCSAIPAAGLEDAYYPYQGWTLGRWHTITTDAIRSALVELHDHYDDKAAMAAEGARWIAGRWQWGDALAQIAALVAD